MKWYKIDYCDELVNLETVKSIRLIEKSINFKFYGEEERFLTEFFGTEEEAKKCFNKIVSELGADDFAY